MCSFRVSRILKKISLRRFFGWELNSWFESLKTVKVKFSFLFSFLALIFWWPGWFYWGWTVCSLYDTLSFKFHLCQYLKRSFLHLKDKSLQLKNIQFLWTKCWLSNILYIIMIYFYQCRVHIIGSINIQIEKVNLYFCNPTNHGKSLNEW